MRRPVIFLAIFFVCYLFLIFPLSSYSRDAKIGDIVVTINDYRVTVYARVTNCFTKKMESAILAGVPTTFTFLVDLYQEKANWFDEKISGVVVKQTIKYDNVKKVFYISSTGGQKESEFQEFDAAKKAMSELNGIAVSSVMDLQNDKSYYILIKAKLDEIRLPLHMEYVLFFVSLWDFETDWHKQKIVF
ncbi:MAG TPA: DUF4390 domain-containing protein [Syntrophales bacterium]|nr:DUF4390 domain-containing protein [Syntrophales bacterium]